MFEENVLIFWFVLTCSYKFEQGLLMLAFHIDKFRCNLGEKSLRRWNWKASCIPEHVILISQVSFKFFVGFDSRISISAQSFRLPSCGTFQKRVRRWGTVKNYDKVEYDLKKQPNNDTIIQEEKTVIDLQDLSRTGLAAL